MEQQTKQLTLREFHHALLCCEDTNKPVVFSGSRTGGVNYFFSWRGSYSEPSCGDAGGDSLPLYEVIKKVNKFAGSIQEGYKGGLYTMREDSGLWADNYGRCERHGVVDVYETDTAIVVETDYCEW